MKLIALSLFALPFLSHAELVAHWTLDETSGTVAADSTANARNGALVGGVTWNTTDLPPVPSGSTAAAQFDGLEGEISITGYKGISGAGDRTISAWIKTDLDNPVNNRAIVSWGSNLNTQKWVFRVQASNGTQGTIRVEANGGYLVGNTIVTDTEWHHVAVTWADDGTPDIQDAKLYVDGVLDAELNHPVTPPSASQSVLINTASGNDVRIGELFAVDRNWQGSIDDVRIFDEALDAVAIQTLALGTPVISSLTASAEVVTSGSAVELAWVSDPNSDSLSIDNGVGDVSGMSSIMVNPTATTTYTLTGTRGGNTKELKVTVLVESAPVVNAFRNLGSETLLVGQSTTVVWDTFGEASLAINGTDLTGQSETVLSPTETTTYTLTATNAFGTITSDLTITVLSESSPSLSWSAAGLPDGNLAQWDPAINTSGNNGITFINNTGGEVQSGTSNFSGVTSWVNRPGYNLSSNPADSWQDGLGDAATKADVSWEMVFRPGDFTGTHVLFNTGGNGDGTALVLTDSTLDFRFQTANTDEGRIIIATDLSTLGAATDFFHIVATADVGAGVSGIANLYVNGQLAVGPVTSTGTLDDWDGGDLAELGKGGNIPASSPFPFEEFTGDIALFNYYGGRILDASQVSALYSEIGGGTGGLAITSIGYDGDTQELSLTFNSLPGRTYALEASNDLTAAGWTELDDSIPSDGTETTIVLSGITLPDPENPKRFYRVRSGVE